MASDTAADEVTALSTKLINAINYQSTLDDSLSQARMELDVARATIGRLEAALARQREFGAGNVWVRRSTIEQERAQERAQTAARVREERRRREEAEAARKKMEQELEGLTAELFEQANNMVARAKEEARAEQQAAARKHDNLRAQVADTETLLRSQQEQLAQLKQVMEDMIEESQSANTTANTTPTSPGFGSFDKDSVRGDGASDRSSNSSVLQEPEEAGAEREGAERAEKTEKAERADKSEKAERNLRPSLRSDTAAYAEFADLVRSGQVHQQLQLLQSADRAHERSPSATSLPKTPPAITAAAAAAALSPPSSPSPQPQLQPHLQPQTQTQPQPSSLPMSMSSLVTVNLNSTSPISPASAWSPSAHPLPSSASANAGTAGALNASSSSSPVPLASLKESRFYKRVLVEDIEPALRLDTAPGIFWLGRRGIMSAMLEGTLVAEPMPLSGSGSASSPAATTAATITAATPADQSGGPRAPCALCGENRSDEEHLRYHRFRLSESDKSTPYALCGYCLARVRAVCDFLGFLRMVKDGHWRADDVDAQHAAWEESVRLRENMFWARIGAKSLTPKHVQPQPLCTPSHSRVASAVQSAENQPPSHGLGITTSNASNASNANNSNNSVGSPATTNGSDSPSQPARPLVLHQKRSSMLSTSMAALVSGLGGHM